ncbi:histone-lysine N-methyltransferase set-17-like, partial [Saccostrea cucullata]|uniref:histone-lysine N-methyltransferase set-17-like n=1 Tax=Saccostrea cuccullata TaxID=36930 RepID=UPI002ED60C17
MKNNDKKAHIMRHRSEVKDAPGNVRLGDDVTKENSELIARLLDNEGITSAWYFNGSVYAKVKDKRVKFDILDDIDHKIPLGSLPHQRANLTTPPGFAIKSPSLPGAGIGAWAETFVPKFTILGVYEGLIHTVDKKEDLYSWQVDKQGTYGTYNIDAEDPACSSWLRFVNSPAKYQQENVVPILCEGIIFYMTSRDVKPGEELLV